MTLKVSRPFSHCVLRYAYFNVALVQSDHVISYKLIRGSCVVDGEFHVDLYTLPDQLVKMLWDFVSSKTDMSVL